MIKERLSMLRNYMKQNGMDAYIIPSSDNHQSEYVGDFFKSREFISGFTGSAGTVVVTMDEAGLWTDGRYFIQAENQLKNTGIKLFKMGEEGVPTTQEFICEKLSEGSTLGFDGRLISANEGKSLEEKLKEKNVTSHIITTLDDIAWLFNIRGRDVKYTPVVLSYAIITLDEVYLFIDENKLNEEIINELKTENVIIKKYDDIYEFVKTMDKTETVLLDDGKVSYSIYNNLPNEVQKIKEPNPTMNFKAVKNNIELDNVRNSHLKDGIAFTKFMYWLKNNVGKIEISEISASEKLEELRRAQEGFIEPSFATIAGYREHAAMMHYSATPESDYKLEASDLFLIDSGGQYFDGTTDITRTIALGEVNSELKTHFTAVLRGMINLSMAKFLYGAKGYNLDILARRPMWNVGLDYKCGTGHGVGFLGTIHEAPNGFRWKIAPNRLETATLEEGMVTTNEPGIYIEGSHGIRIENELITKKAEKNEYGQFMEFEVVTFAPIDLDAINVDDLNKEERDYLNNYHRLVYEKISPYLTEEENVWLKKYTRGV